MPQMKELQSIAATSTQATTHVTKQMSIDTVREGAAWARIVVKHPIAQ